MPDANQQQKPLPIRDEFRSLLDSKWTRHVACQNECRPPESCSCQRKIVHVHAVEAWWKKQASESPNTTKLERFVHEMRPLPHRTLPVQPKKISRGGRSCLRILSLLLNQEREHLIDRFYEASMYDDYLARSENDQNLREQLAGHVRRDEVETIIGDFHTEKWRYCPLTLTLDMDENLHGTKVIPPFCLKIKLPAKGGTASIYWVAVQKDLISDNALALALQDSVYTDDDFGECYQMVLKSYCGNKKRDFDLEKEAFSGLQSNDQVPILKYLGSYTHDYGEGEEFGKTYNLLLEYGENDLYQAWADETNVPPVQAQEILQNWKSIFNVAEAIRHVHHLEIRRGKGQYWRFHGWHSDIKPDNILSVRGRLKLADFGFSSFAPVVEGHDGSEPKDVIRGFTDTYGAPEVSRMKQPDGTLSGVSQSIDAWSFGCVLSVAATWIALGFQGLRQYERLRQLSPANNKDGLTSDRFHDGFDVLPEVEKWHNYLRGHLRSSDTTTEQVLDLIETRLLRADPAARYNIEELCEKLKKVSSYAALEIKNLKKNSKDTDPIVMKALKKIEEEAQVQRSSEPKTNLLQQPLLQVNPRERASMQVNKEELIRKKPLGQTAHRKQILEKKLENCGVMNMGDEPLSGVHNGAITNSPVDHTSLRELPYNSCKTKPTNPRLQASDQSQSDRGHRTPNGAHHDVNSVLLATPPPSDRQRKIYDLSTGIYSDDPFTTNPHATSSDNGLRSSPNLGKPDLHISTPDSPLVNYFARFAQANDFSELPSPSKDKEPVVQKPNFFPLSVHRPENTGYIARPPLNTPEQGAIGRGVGERNSPPTNRLLNPQSHGKEVSVPGDASPMGSPLDDKRIYEPPLGATSLLGFVADVGPSIILSHPKGAQSPRDQSVLPQSNVHAPEKQAVEREPTPHAYTSSESNDPFLLTLPSTVLSLPYDICARRKDLDEQVSNGLAKGLAKLKDSLGIETRARDASLVETFNDRRELVFVIDNGWTMSEHWPIVTFVAQTLAKNAAGLDKDGFDVKFTVDGNRHNLKRLKGDSDRKRFKRVLKAAWPEYRKNDHVTTDMARVFANIFEEWNHSGQKATTLLVLTDGVWSKTNLDALNSTILDIAKKDQFHAGNRQFSIQFIRFGDGDIQRNRLQWLDDALCDGHKLRDIIDHCSWRAKVDKMFKGSIEGYLDEQDSDEEPILYDYTRLVDLFDTFNRAEDGTLSPTNSLFRTPSRSSHRSSASLPHALDRTGRR